jgi:hypothetical protein
MKRLLAALLACCLLGTSHKLHAGNEDEYLRSAVRSITHAAADSTVVLHVKVSSKGIGKLNGKLFYYWEKQGAVRKNQGSFSGNVLHGRYTATNAKGMMVTEGYFYNGTRDGCWKKWDSSGRLVHADAWEKGYRKRAERYDNGTLSEKVAYGKNGKPRRKLDYTSGRKETFVYKGNAWVAKRRLLSAFRRKQKPVNADDSTVNGVR